MSLNGLMFHFFPPKLFLLMCSEISVKCEAQNSRREYTWKICFKTTFEGNYMHPVTWKSARRLSNYRLKHSVCQCQDKIFSVLDCT